MMPTESPAIPYDLNRARFVRHGNWEKLEDCIRHPLAPLTKLALLPELLESISLISVPKLNVYGPFPSFTIDPHRKLVSYEQ
jgi:hypothetical protein